MSGYAIRAERLVKRYVTWIRRGFFRRSRRVVEALKGVSFDVKWGEVFGLLGPNGAGKTTTVKIISTLLLPEGGNAWVSGYSVLEDPVEVRERIGVVLSVERGFFWKLTGRENLRYFAMLRGMRGRELEKRIDEVLEIVGLKRLGGEDKLYEEYSLGMKARLALARALIHDPPVLMLDEPTLGLDPPAAREVRELLVRLAHRDGKGVLVTTHNMFEAEMICDRVAIISEGRIAAIGTVNDLKKLVADEVPVVIKFTGMPGNASTRVEEALIASLGTGRLQVSESDGGLTARILAEAGMEERVISRAIDVLTRLGYSILRVEVAEPSLEDVFIFVTRGGGDAG